MSLHTPVVFLIFNRPDLTAQVFEAIRQAKPHKLLVVADGPRFSEEAEKCEKARVVIQQVDWECEVLTNFSNVNLGCKCRVSSGLDWVFSEVEEAIILEDDCLPTPSFFTFCQTLLEYYRHDERIMHISGNNFQLSQSRSEYSYYFSKYNHIWGWASWRRAWKHYDIEMKTWEELKVSKIINSVHTDAYEQNYWLNIFDQVHKGLIDTWDYQWTYACWSQGGLSIIPDVNLVSNIGFGDDATNTVGKSRLANMPTEDINKINHPPFIIKHQEADLYTFDYVFGEKTRRETSSIYHKLLVRVSNIRQYIKNVYGQL